MTALHFIGPVWHFRRFCGFVRACCGRVLWAWRGKGESAGAAGDGTARF